MKKSIQSILAAVLLSATLALAGCKQVNIVGMGKNMNSSDASYNDVTYDDSDKYTIVSGVGTAEGNVKELSIGWISGDIKLEYADVDKITFFEDVDISDQDTKKMYVYENADKLNIQFVKAGKLEHLNLSKDLVIQIPRNMRFSEVDIETVSASVVADGLDIEDFDLETVSGAFDVTEEAQFGTISIDSVSGDMNIRGKVHDKIDIETVSGKAKLQLHDLTGFEAVIDSVSGTLKTNLATQKDNEDVYTYGDQSLKIEFDSVSGDVEIETY